MLSQELLDSCRKHARDSDNSKKWVDKLLDQDRIDALEAPYSNEKDGEEALIAKLFEIADVQPTDETMAAVIELVDVRAKGTSIESSIEKMESSIRKYNKEEITPLPDALPMCMLHTKLNLSSVAAQHVAGILQQNIAKLKNSENGFDRLIKEVKSVRRNFSSIEKAPFPRGKRRKITSTQGPQCPRWQKNLQSLCGPKCNKSYEIILCWNT